MTSYTTKANYPYPAATDAITEYPTTAATFAGYLDNLPNRNRIINGCFDVWQRGTSFSGTSGSYTADRWIFTHNGTGGTRSVTQETNTPGSLIGGMQAHYYLKVLVTNAGSPAATSQTIGQRVENVRTFAAETVTISGWANSSGGYTNPTLKAIQNFGTGGSPSSAVTTTIGTITVTGSWTRFSATVTLPSISGKTIGTNGNDYVEIQLELGGGTGNISLWGIQLEQNTTATALEREPIQQTLAKCQRYFERYNGADGGLPPQSPIQVDNANRPEIILHYSLKRTSPTISWSSNAHFYVENLTGAGSAVPGGLATYVGTGTRNSNLFFPSTSGWTAYVPCFVTYAVTSAYIDVSAEL